MLTSTDTNPLTIISRRTSPRRRRRALAALFILPVVLLLLPMPGDTARMQSTQDEFNPNANNSVLALAQQSDGNIIMGGQFTTVTGQTRNFIARVNSEGTLDAAFNPGANNFVFVVTAQPDGKILVGGTFTTIGGTARNRMARLNADGTLDAAFDASIGGNAVFAFALQPDNKIIVGGLFTSAGGATRNGIARLNADGTLDTTFDPNADARVQAIVVQPDGKIVIGGDFNTVGGTARANIARLNSDGTLDTAFNPGASTTVGALALQADGKILLGGSFTSVGGVARTHLARLNADGSVDTSFDANANSLVSEIVVEADGRILVAGAFNTIGGQSRTGIARLTSNGLADPSLNPNVNNSVGTLIVQADGKVVIAGGFTAVNGVTRNRIARFPAPTPGDVTLPSDPVRPVSAGQNDVGNSPSNEDVANAIDNTTNKYLNFNSTNSGFIVTPRACSSVVQGLRIFTANDSPTRDPASYRLEGSDDGANFTLISEGALALPEGRNPTGQPITAENLFSQTVLFSNSVSYRAYRLTFPTIKDVQSANSMQIGEAELLGTRGASAPFVVSVAAADPNPTTAPSVNFRVTFNESVTGVDITDFAVTVTDGNLSGAEVIEVSNDASDPTGYTVRVGNYTGAGTLRLDVLDDDSIINAGQVPLGCRGSDNGGLLGAQYTILPPCTPPPSGMVAWYAGDGDATDLIGNNNGVLVGDVGFAAGKVASGFDFAEFSSEVRNVRVAPNSYVAIEDAPDAALDLTGDLTLDAWVLVPFDSGGGTLISKQSLDGGDVSYRLSVSDGQLRFSAANAQDEDSGALAAPSPIPQGEYVHVAATIETVNTGLQATTKVLTLYVNGNLAATDGDFAITRPDTTGRLTLGAIETNDGSTNEFNGRIDEVELFDRALSQDEIRAIVEADASGKCKPVQVTTEDDAYVRGATPSTNYGESPELQVKRTLNPGNGKGRQAYLRFDTSSQEGEVSRAVLRVYGGLNAVTPENVNLPVAVFPVSDQEWTEETITWNNRPAPNAPFEIARVFIRNYRPLVGEGTPDNPNIVADDTPRWYDFDITDYVNQERAAGRKVGMLLRNMQRGGIGDFYTRFNSKESEENRPRLLLTIAPPIPQ